MKMFFLPQNIPEEIIWSDDTLNKADLDSIEKREILSEENLKLKFNLFASFMFGNNTIQDQNKAYDYFLVRWLKSENTDYNYIKNLLTRLKEI